MIGVADMKYTGSSQVIKFSKKKYITHMEKVVHMWIYGSSLFPKKMLFTFRKKDDKINKYNWKKGVM